ncbi:MAG: PorV/PorQ family protein [Chitinispirillaceae bacterium]|nr:PorV/PorQ family protein [Chitinispirillaceae bacterium]
MRLFSCKTCRLFATAAVFMLAVMAVSAWCGVGQSAVITLVFPPGARATGLGEAFTAVSDDANAIFFNPAGLGLDPLANSWKSFKENKGPFAGVASKRKTDIISSELVWVGTASGVLRFNGKVWETQEIYLVEQGDDLASIARRYLNVDDPEIIAQAVWILRKENGIEMKRYNLVLGTLRSRLSDSLLVKSKTGVESIARQIIDLPPAERSAGKLFGLLSPYADSSILDRLSDDIASLLGKKDTELDELVELRVPFTIAINDSVTAMAMDESDRLWVGTKNGLWRCSESKWSRTTVVDGLPSNVITSITLGSYGDMAVGTDIGLGIYKNGTWSSKTVADGLPDSAVTAVLFGASGTIYAGTKKGLALITDSALTVYDTADGLLSPSVTSLLYDSENRLWIGGDNGVTILDGTSWKRYKFPGSVVSSIAQQRSGSVWIGTNKGVINYKQGSKDGLPEWKSYHSKNALVGDAVTALATYGNDVWVVTDKAINKYEWAQMQTLLFWEPLLPAFGLRELWHTFGAFVFPTEDWGTIGGSINFINMGLNEWTDELGRNLGKARSWEGIFGLSYGLSLTQSLSLGVNMKYIVSALAPGIGRKGAGVGQGFAVDAAVLKRDLFIRNLSLGFMLQNMGPSIYYIDPEKSDPIPFTLRFGSAYTAVQSPLHELTFLLDLNREVVKNYIERKPDNFWTAIWTDLISDEDESPKEEVQQINVNLGAEYWYSQFLAIRTGFLGDYIGERYELTLGLGLNYGNMNFDWSYIHAPEGFLKGALQKINSAKGGASGARDGQYRVSFLFKL